MPARRTLAALLATASLLTACDALGGDAADEATPTAEPTAATEADGAPARIEVGDCLDTSALGDALVADPLTAWSCAEVLVVAATPEVAPHAVAIAGALGGPAILADHPGLSELRARLGEARVVDVGPTTTSAEVLDGATRAYVADRDDDDAVAAAAVLAGRDGVPLHLVTPGPSADWVEVQGFEELVVVATDGGTDLVTSARPHAQRVRLLPGRDLAGLLATATGTPADAGGPGRAWLVPDGAQGLLRLPLLASTAARAGHLLVPLPEDLLGDLPVARRLAGLFADDVVLAVPRMSPLADDAPGRERLARSLAILHGPELPGGGWDLAGKRFIAMYGTPGTPSLGVLGEQDVEATVARIREIAAPYDVGDVPVVPTFEIIATVASASATDDGDYSYGISHDVIREWVDVAAREGFQVVLDLQPGRTDFLTQAKRLEEFLVQPHVGLALDPEWRLKPNQVHLRQIGSVTAAEVNTVVDWLVELVRTHDLPDKLLVLHQFKNTMLVNRDDIRVPEELTVVLHMDGQGGLSSKYGTYGALFDDGRPQAQGMLAGWKNFYDEDRPMANAEQVLALDPPSWFISFQ